MSSRSEPDYSQLVRSWRTRFASVVRQLEKLAAESPVELDGKLVEVVGVMKMKDEWKISVRSPIGMSSFLPVSVLDKPVD